MIDCGLVRGKDRIRESERVRTAHDGKAASADAEAEARSVVVGEAEGVCAMVRGSRVEMRARMRVGGCMVMGAGGEKVALSWGWYWRLNEFVLLAEYDGGKMSEGNKSDP